MTAPLLAAEDLSKTFAPEDHRVIALVTVAPGRVPGLDTPPVGPSPRGNGTVTAPLLAAEGLPRISVPEGGGIATLDDVSLLLAPGGDTLTPVRLRPGGGGTMTAALLAAAGLSNTVFPAGRCLAGPGDVSPASGGPRFREAAP